MKKIADTLHAQSFTDIKVQTNKISDPTLNKVIELNQNRNDSLNRRLKRIQEELTFYYDLRECMEDAVYSLKPEEYNSLEKRYYENQSMKVIEIEMKYSRGHLY